MAPFSTRREGKDYMMTETVLTKLTQNLSSDWPTDQPIDQPTDRPPDRPTSRSTGRQIDRPTDRLIDLQFGCQITVVPLTLSLPILIIIERCKFT